MKKLAVALGLVFMLSATMVFAVVPKIISVDPLTGGTTYTYDLSVRNGWITHSAISVIIETSVNVVLTLPTDKYEVQSDGGTKITNTGTLYADKTYILEGGLSELTIYCPSGSDGGHITIIASY